MVLPRMFTPPQVPRDDLRPKSRTCGPVGLRNAPAGAVQASSPTGVCNIARLAFSRCPPPPSAVGADSISARKTLRRRTDVRVAAAVPFGRAFARVCRGGPWSSRGCSRRHRFPGTISGLRAGPAVRLASETRLRAQCKHRPLQGFVILQGLHFPGVCTPPSAVGADSISARETLRHRGVRRDEGIPPYGRPGGRGRPVWPDICPATGKLARKKQRSRRGLCFCLVFLLFRLRGRAGRKGPTPSALP